MAEDNSYTNKFRTKTDFMVRKNIQPKNVWEIAIDVGYSAVKSFSPNMVSRFPSYARRMTDGEDIQFAFGTPKTAIQYKDLENGGLWIVGEKAQELMADKDTTDSEASLYGRERYFGTMFHVVTQAGFGISMMENEFGKPEGKKVVVQTGLPDKYMGDEEDLKDSMSGRHHFMLKVGSLPWKEYDFTLDPEDITVMSQPKGTLFSTCVQKDGTYTPDAKEILSSSVIVFDPGFGTLDIFPIKAGVVGRGETYPDLGMKRVLQETSAKIKENFKVDVPVPAMQKYLSTGLVRYVSNKDLVSKDYPFEALLKEASERICDEAIIRMNDVLSIGEYNYLIVTGGTGAAWYDRICEKFKNFSTLKIIRGNRNDDLSFVFSNARGYYYHKYFKLRDLEK